MSLFRIEALDTARHRRDEFHCESPELTEFLRTRARKAMEARAYGLAAIYRQARHRRNGESARPRLEE